MTIDERLDRVGQMIEALTLRQDGLTMTVELLSQDIRLHSQAIQSHSQDLQLHTDNFKQTMAGIDGLLRIVHSHEERLWRIEGEGSV